MKMAEFANINRFGIAFFSANIDQAALEDSLVAMSTILSSRYVAGIRNEVEKVERQLLNFSDTLDQWVQVRGGPADSRAALGKTCFRGELFHEIWAEAAWDGLV
jgi:hypothetical protein